MATPSMKFAPALTIQLGKSINHSGKLVVSKNKVVLQRLNIGGSSLIDNEHDVRF
jgi:hypothetical protein